jgi:hypothetical protein
MVVTAQEIFFERTAKALPRILLDEGKEEEKTAQEIQ